MQQYEEAWDVTPWIIGTQFLRFAKGEDVGVGLEDLVTPRSLPHWDLEAVAKAAREGELSLLIRPHTPALVELRLIYGKEGRPREHGEMYVATGIYVERDDRLGWRIHAMGPAGLQDPHSVYGNPN